MNQSITILLVYGHSFNSSLPEQNGRRFADDVFKCIFINEKLCILIQISLKYVPRSPIDNKPALVLIMAWHWTGDKPLPEPIMTHICSTRGRWVKRPQFPWNQSPHFVSALETKCVSPSDFYTLRNEVSGGYIGFTLSVRLSVCLSVNLSCPPCSIYSSGWILSIFGTNDH